MATEIKTWQIVNGRLTSIDTNLRSQGRTEPYDLEPWLASNPEIIGTDLLVIGKQVQTKSGPIDLLGIDSSGNTVIVELKREQLPRECLAQAIDYASDVADWSRERLGEICSTYAQKSLEEAFSEAFPEADLESLTVNGTQRIVLVGFSIEAALERMIEWLSENFGVNANAVVLSYVKTRNGEELLTRTSIISEEVELQRSRKQKKFEIPMSDEPGTYDLQTLKQRLAEYLSRDKVTNRRMRDVLFPALLGNKVVTRDELARAVLDLDPRMDETKVGLSISSVSSQLGLAKNDFLRQVVAYSYPRHQWEKDNFQLRPEYRDLIKEVLAQLKTRP